MHLSRVCPGPNPGGPFLCNKSTWTGDPEKLAIALGQMKLDWMSADEYYDVTTATYRQVYEKRLYPHIRPEQRLVLIPFAAYCEIGCQSNESIAPVPADSHCLDSARTHLLWAQSDSRVIGIFIYRLKNLWQKKPMLNFDACKNPWGTGLGLMDRCGINGEQKGWAMPQTLNYYKWNASRLLHQL